MAKSHNGMRPQDIVVLLKKVTLSGRCMKRVLPKIYERYFQKSTGEYEDIIVVKPDYSVGLYFTVEEHRFFISAW